MIVAHTMMMEGDLQAMDRPVKLTRELDRYHGFGKLSVSLSEPSPPRRLSGPRRQQLTAPNSGPSEAETKIFLATKH